MPDYIIGGGSAGCVVASRLSERAFPCSFEEGPRDSSIAIHLPVMVYKTATDLLQRFEQGPTPGILPKPPVMVQRVLGGGSSVNAMLYVRGIPADATAGPSRRGGWAYRDAAILQAPRITTPVRRGAWNRRTAARSSPEHISPLTKTWLKAARSQSPHVTDFNAGASPAAATTR